jgi:hypothetical protein
MADSLIRPIAVNVNTGDLTYSGSLTTSEITDGTIASADLNLASVAAALAARSEITGAFAPIRTSAWLPSVAFQVVLGSPTFVATQSSPCWTLDQSTSEAVAASLIPDYDLPGWTAYHANVVWTVATAISGDVMFRWDPSETAISGGTLASASGSTTTVTAPATNVLASTRVATSVAITTTSKQLALRLTRIATNVADTLNGDASVLGVLLTKV